MGKYLMDEQETSVPAGLPGPQASLPLSERVYTNLGNAPLINLLSGGSGHVLDVGCGAGDNATLIKSRGWSGEVCGITYSAAEAERARAHMKECWVMDVEADLPKSLLDLSFDVIIFSHILEHLRYPAGVVAKFSQILSKGGQVLIAIPNILSYRMRLQFLRGDFRYSPEGGVLDDTHLHFYTYFTADEYLLSESTDLKLTNKAVSGSVPLCLLRRHIFPTAWSKTIDAWGERNWPNLFGNQIVMRAVKQ